MITINYKKSYKDCVKFYLRLLSLLDNKSVLTEAEATVLVEFLCLPEKFKYMRFSLVAKKKVAESLGLSAVNVNNKLYSLIEKNYLKRDEDNIIYAKDFVNKFINNFKNTFEINVKLECKEESGKEE